MKAYAAITRMAILLVALATGFVYADEPEVPDVDHIFSPRREQRINQLTRLSSQEVIKVFRSPEFFDEEEYLDKAIFRAFNFRKGQARRLALGHVRSVQAQTEAESHRRLYIAKRVFQIFPDEALDDLLDIYSSGGPKVKSNVIFVLGQMRGSDAIKMLLVEALNDTDDCQDITDETLGDPLRVCDMAYNQLVLRYKVRNVLRTIGSSHSMDVRDYYIALLKHQIQ